MGNRFYVQSVLVMLVFSLSIFAVMAQDQVLTLEEGATVSLQNAEGETLGIVSFAPQENRVLITADVGGLAPGFYGFHIHTTGSCEDSGDGPFTAAGGHLNLDESNHPGHAGDLPSLLVIGDGTAYLSVSTDRFTVESLFDEDGSAMMIHGSPDNYANIPERYGTPDQDTLDTGDAGDRIACGVIEQGSSVEMLETVEPTPAG